MTDNSSRAWRNLPEPPPGHPDAPLLWEAEQALDNIQELAENPDIRNAFVRRLGRSVPIWKTRRNWSRERNTGLPSSETSA